MINVTIENFEVEVIAASVHTPVLVDFWAPWCGPCKVIGPLLEKAEETYAGRFKLVKIDSDKEPQLSQAFGIRSIPTCILVIDGKPVDGFQGALPQSQIEAFLDKHLPSSEELEAQADAQDAQALLAAGDPQAALYKLQEALLAAPKNDDARYDYVRLLIENKQLDAASAALSPTLAAIPRQLRFEALGHMLDALHFAATDPQGQWTPAQFDTLLEGNKRDFDSRLSKARVLMAQEQWTAAMDELLEIILRDKTWSDAIARKTFVAILEWLHARQVKPGKQDAQKSGSSIEIAGKPMAEQDPQAQLIASYRRKLSMALN